ncbi:MULTISPECIES: polysaccharide biosynthesis protein [unclassified Bradyrhizobium]|uniref:polysaccharide biosynthesis protein n=1 Tax=unclassified Bradyrhizobium TaxID=2631580 RepID=UPI001CD2AC0C|nr:MULTISPECIES: polysaccharide biosynthesis protein [unclassified Bradyrhizobium]
MQKVHVTGISRMLGGPTYRSARRRVFDRQDAMGMSNAFMEKPMAVKATSLALDTDTILCANRYGKVMASRGYVIASFVTHAKAGPSITPTDRTTPPKARNCSMSTAWKTVF